jgi:hypothetical protein
MSCAQGWVDIRIGTQRQAEICCFTSKRIGNSKKSFLNQSTFIAEVYKILKINQKLTLKWAYSYQKTQYFTSILKIETYLCDKMLLKKDFPE